MDNLLHLLILTIFNMSDLQNKYHVIGAGTMGNGIAHVFAQHGFTVTLIDVNPSQLEKALQPLLKILTGRLPKASSLKNRKQATLKNITTVNRYSEGVKNADLVVEAATENVDLETENI